MEMIKVVLLILSLLFASVGFADGFVLNNQVANPPNNNNFKMAIQWASSVKDIKEYDNTIKQGAKLNPSSLQVLARAGKIDVAIPKNMEYFRVLVWSKDIKVRPDLLTNWVDITPNKIYTLNEDQLTPLALMAGMGC